MSDLLCFSFFEPGGGLLSVVKPRENFKFLNETSISGLQRSHELRPRSEKLTKKKWR